jgi:hypothetical protein
MKQKFKVPICKRHSIYGDFMLFSMITLLLALMFSKRYYGSLS